MTITLVSFAFFFGLLISRIGLPPMVGFLVAWNSPLKVVHRLG